MYVIIVRIFLCFRYFATVLRHSSDFDVGEKHHSPDGDYITLAVSITQGDRTKVDCFDNAHTDLGPLKPNQVGITYR